MRHLGKNLLGVCLFLLSSAASLQAENAMDPRTMAGDVRMLSTDAERAHLPKNAKTQAVFLDAERLTIAINEALSDKKAVWIQIKNEAVNVLPLSYEASAQRIVGFRQDNGARVVIRQAEVETAAR